MSGSPWSIYDVGHTDSQWTSAGLRVGGTNGWMIGNTTSVQRISNNSGTFSMLNSSNAWADVQMANLQINGKITAYNSAAVNINDRLNVTNNGSQSIWYAAGGIAIISDDNDNQTDSDIIFGTNSATTASGMDELLRITDEGLIGIGGANYGTDGQVLTSNGSGAAPAWEDASGGGGAGTSIAMALIFGGGFL